MCSGCKATVLNSTSDFTTLLMDKQTHSLSGHFIRHWGGFLKQAVTAATRLLLSSSQGHPEVLLLLFFILTKEPVVEFRPKQLLSSFFLPEAKPSIAVSREGGTTYMVGQIDGAANSVKIDWRVAWKHHAARFMKGEHEEARTRRELWEMFSFVLLCVQVRGRLNSKARE